MVKIESHPTITICLGEPLIDGEFYKYGTDFNITYAIIAEDYLTYIDYLTLSIGENYLNISQINFNLF